MFWKQERSEMEDFERKKKLGFKGKISLVYKNIFAYSFVSEHSKYFFKLAFLAARGANLHS